MLRASGCITTKRMDVTNADARLEGRAMSPESEFQGNIRNAFARGHCVYLFVCFNRGAETVPVLRDITGKYVVSGEQQAAGGRTFGMFGLSAAGYRQLGLEGAAPADPDRGSN